MTKTLTEQYGDELVEAARDPRIPALPLFELRNGIPMSDIGEDGDAIALGHHDDDTMLAAVRLHWGEMVGLAAVVISRRWAVSTTGGCRPGDCPPKDPYSPWYDDDGNCLRCAEIKENSDDGGWWLDHGDEITEQTPDAFPVTWIPA